MTELVYPDLKINGKLFPLWVLKNFKKYKLDSVNKQSTEKNKGKKELTKYQKFIGSYLDYRSPYREILLYHGLGSGKTATTINIYNILFNYNPNWNIFILTKASLKKSVWLKELPKWLSDKHENEIMDNIKYIHYDSPRAEKDFIETVKSVDTQKTNIYIIEEAHNFIRNVYNNIITKAGKKAFVIYDYIQREKKDKKETRIVLLSGTPAINSPFELALMFNLLRPETFPMSQKEFYDLYITNNNDIQILKTENKNMFQRRIMGLVSYYKGYTADVFAKKNIFIKKMQMDQYQEDIYEHFLSIEKQLEKKQTRKTGTKIYKSYTRQASNFVFPVINEQITGENRPRPSKFKLSDEEIEKVMEGKTEQLLKIKGSDAATRLKNDLSLYMETMRKYVESFDTYLRKKNQNDKLNGFTIYDDFDTYKNTYKYKFKDFWINHKNKSSLLTAMYKCSSKMTGILFYMLQSHGPILVYSNYVKVEGLEIFKVYLHAIGFTNFNKEEGTNGKRYIEYHGDIDQSVRAANIDKFNQKINIKGDIIKVILISSAGSEGISLRNVRQVHILEPYWEEVRIEQLIGRAIRKDSHNDLPPEERVVDIYRYLATKTNSQIETTDMYIYHLADAKQKLINTFLQTLKEVAVDCELFKNHNMIQDKYNCFKFSEKVYFDGLIGPAYKEDIYYDMKINDGLNSENAIIKKIKVIKIKAIYKIGNIYSTPEYYWYNTETGVIYDFETDYPVGKVFITDGIPHKFDKETYIIDQQIDVPSVNVI